MKLSVCLIVKNEEKYLNRCLNSIAQYVDEIIITDT
jgi:glycosyltransferase involved in cell wall biosynthesis